MEPLNLKKYRTEPEHRSTTKWDETKDVDGRHLGVLIGSKLVALRPFHELASSCATSKLHSNARNWAVSPAGTPTDVSWWIHSGTTSIHFLHHFLYVFQTRGPCSDGHKYLIIRLLPTTEPKWPAEKLSVTKSSILHPNWRKTFNFWVFYKTNEAFEGY